MLEEGYDQTDSRTIKNKLEETKKLQIAQIEEQTMDEPVQESQEISPAKSKATGPVFVSWEDAGLTELEGWQSGNSHEETYRYF